MRISFGQADAPPPPPAPIHPLIKIAIASGLAYFFFWSMGPGSEPLPQHGRK
jgi:hypothetical protein